MTIKIGVTTTTASVSLDEAKKLAAALDVQVKRDLKPIWEVDAEVIFFEYRDAVPPHVHPIIIVESIPHGVAGAHQIQNGITFANVNAQRNWRLAASHECLEMLVDPTGRKMIPSTAIGLVDGAIADIDDEFHYLLEVCDPVEDPKHSYAIDGVVVSDFYTPEYLDRKYKPGVRYSFCGALTRPREVLPNGYLTWFHPKTETLHQIRHFDGLKMFDVPPWAKDGDMSARMFIDQNTRTPRSHPLLKPAPSLSGPG